MNNIVRFNTELRIYYYDSNNDSSPTIPFTTLDNDIVYFYNLFKSRDILNVNGKASFVEPRFLTIGDKLNNLDSLNGIAYTMARYMKIWYFDLDIGSRVLHGIYKDPRSDTYSIDFTVILPHSRNVINLITKGKFQHIFQVAKNIYEKIIDYNIPFELKYKVIDEVIEENKEGQGVDEIFRNKYSKEESDSKSGLVDSSIDKSIIPDTGFKPNELIVLYSYSSDKTT